MGLAIENIKFSSVEFSTHECKAIYIVDKNILLIYTYNEVH